MRTARRVPEVIGHGGAGWYCHGNSESSFRKALEIGVDRIECDVRRSADGDLVLVHDERLPLPSGEQQAVAQFTTDQIRELVPELLLLPDLVELVAGRVPLMIDVKGPGYEEEIIAVIRDGGLAGASSVSSTHASTLLRLRRAFPSMRLGLSTGHMGGVGPALAGQRVSAAALRLLAPAPLLLAARLARATEVMLYQGIVTRPFVTAVHATGRRVNIWTVDQPDDVRRAIGLGVDGIISNRPDLVRQMLDESRGS